jgi:hypothetical protein
MKITTAKEILFRPHAIGSIMSGVKKGWDVEHSLTCKRYLLKIFREIQYGRYHHQHNKYLEKGIAQEDDVITLMARKLKLDIQKNTTRFKNKWFDGEPDIVLLPRTLDAKASWGLDTFPDDAVYEPEDGYVYQGTAYNSLTGATAHTISYGLVNATANLIDKEKSSAWWRMGCPDKESMEWAMQELEIERNMIFDWEQFRSDNPGYVTLYNDRTWQYDIPWEARLYEHTIPFDPKLCAKIIDRVEECRDWMQSQLFKKLA